MAQTVPSQAEVVAAWRGRLTDGKAYRKVAKMHATRMEEGGKLETVLGGKLETTNSYVAGDWVLHGTEGERYAIPPHLFEQRYITSSSDPAETATLSEEGFRLYVPRGKVWARQLSADDIATNFPLGKFTAAWGAAMYIEPGDFLAAPHPEGGEIYRIEANAFAHTYAADESGTAESACSRSCKRSDEVEGQLMRRVRSCPDALEKGSDDS